MCSVVDKFCVFDTTVRLVASSSTTLVAMALVFAVMAVVFEAVVVSSASTLDTDALSAVCNVAITWFWTKITCLNSSMALLIEKRLELLEK
jgi:hypothetical protein